MRARRLSTGARSAVLVAVLLGAFPSARAPAASGEPDPAAAEWRADLAHLIATLERVHPNLYARVDREVFHERAEALRAAIPELEDEQIVVRLMQLVASVEDGHTSLDPIDPAGFGRWYPVRFYRFTDGIFITAIDRRFGRHLGARVDKIGRLTADRAWELTASLRGADNEFGALQRAPFYLSNATALRALGVTDGRDRLTLEVRLADDAAETIELEAVDAGFDLDFQYWGEIWGPASSKVGYAALDGRSSDDFYDEHSELPLHLRYRSSYWFTYLEAPKLFYVQLNSLGDSHRRNQTFAEFNDSLWRAVDAADIDSLVIDIRYNIGGDGSLVNSFVHEIIKRDRVNRKGTIFAVVGRATFSAGVMLARALEEHTEATFVGEPPGAYWQHYGDGTSFRLPNSGLEVWVSTIYHQLSSYTEGRRVMPIELPAQFASADYFGLRDPALEQIHGSRDRPLLAEIFRRRGAEQALEAYERRLAEYGAVEWWAPFTLAELNRLGHELLDAGRADDALAAYRLNARRHPNHWRPWHSLGRAHRKLGHTEAAIESYQRALEVDPFNNLAPYQRQALAELGAGR